MIYQENTARLPGIHTTLVFKPLGLLDSQECTDALRKLGVPSTVPGIEPELAQGPWLACGLDSDGTIRLWPSDYHP